MNLLKQHTPLKIPVIAAYIIFALVFSMLSGILMIRYVPYFKNTKRLVIQTALNTRKHVYIAYLVASAEEIKELSAQGMPDIGMGLSDASLIDVKYKGDKGIEFYDIKAGRFSGKLLKVKDPTRIKVVMSEKIPESGELTSDIAKRCDAVAAINGGGFWDGNGSGTGGRPIGHVISEFSVLFAPEKVSSYTDVVGFDASGVLIVGREVTEKVLKMNLKEQLSFKPALIMDGRPLITHGDGGMGISGRTAIGQTYDGEVLLLVVDGRQVDSIGAYLVDVQNIMLKFGAVNAANLDGGSSTTMYYHKKLVNQPSDPLGERLVPSVFLVMP